MKILITDVLVFVAFTITKHLRLDILNYKKVKSFLQTNKFDTIIHLATIVRGDPACRVNEK